VADLPGLQRRACAAGKHGKVFEPLPRISDEKRRKFAAHLSALDDGVGAVLNALRQTSQEENTLVFFFSDNGGPTPSTTSGNGPLRGFKAQTWEGGVRVPWMVQWKGPIPRREGG
jgi:arylsulfatase A-like enzyme